MEFNRGENTSLGTLVKAKITKCLEPKLQAIFLYKLITPILSKFVSPEKAVVPSFKLRRPKESLRIRLSLISRKKSFEPQFSSTIFFSITLKIFRSNVRRQIFICGSRFRSPCLFSRNTKELLMAKGKKTMMGLFNEFCVFWPARK